MEGREGGAGWLAGIRERERERERERVQGGGGGFCSERYSKRNERNWMIRAGKQGEGGREEEEGGGGEAGAVGA
jgi:hypothetical protein